MVLEALEIVVAIGFDGGVLEAAVRPRGLAVRPGTIRLNRPMLDEVGNADAIEEVWTEEASGRAVAILAQVGEGRVFRPPRLKG